MASEFDDNKTEAPTPRKRESAREEGQVIFSPDLTSGILLFSITLGCWLFGAAWIDQIGTLVVDHVRGIRRTDWSMSHSLLSVRWLATQMLMVAGGITAGAWVLNAATASLQAGFGFHSKPLELDAEKLSPIKGWERLWSLDGLMKGVMASLKLSGLMLAAAAFTWLSKDSVTQATRGNLRDSMAFSGELVTMLMLILSGIALIFGALDYLFRRHRHEEKLKMSHEELKQEQKDDQGDQQVKQQMRKFRQEARTRRSLRDVPSATAVITNPTHFAVAVRYDSKESTAPVVVAKGADLFAKQIIKVAQQHGVPVLERKPVARALYAFAEVGDEIPLELYRAVAEVLAEVYKRKQRR